MKIAPISMFWSNQKVNNSRPMDIKEAEKTCILPEIEYK